MTHPSSKPRKRLVKVYDYVDKDGNLVSQKCRCDPKGFNTRRPDTDRPGEYIWDLKGVETPLYRLPEVLEAIRNGETVFVVEGEKDADALYEIGLTATTNIGGAGKWKKAYTKVLSDPE